MFLSLCYFCRSNFSNPAIRWSSQQQNGTGSANSTSHLPSFTPTSNSFITSNILKVAGINPSSQPTSMEIVASPLDGQQSSATGSFNDFANNNGSGSGKPPLFHTTSALSRELTQNSSDPSLTPVSNFYSQQSQHFSLYGDNQMANAASSTNSLSAAVAQGPNSLSAYNSSGSNTLFYP